MACKIDIQLIDAIQLGCYLKTSNTCVKWYGDSWEVILHGNVIARYEAKQQLLHLDCCGRHTAITRDRLNAICKSVGIALRYHIKDSVIMYGLDPGDRNTFNI
jgi:hypothetical protein